MSQINADGARQISGFINDNHVNGAAIVSSPIALMKWFEEANENLQKGNAASVEIKPWNSRSQRSVEYTVTDGGIDH